MNLEHIMLYEIRQTWKDTYCTIPLTRGTQNSQIHGHQVGSGYQDLGEGGMESSCLMRMEFLFEMMKMFWKWIMVMVAQYCEYTECRWTVHLKIEQSGKFYVMYILP